MMFDKVEKISNSVIQHGPNNDRVYLMKIDPEENIESLIEQLFNLSILKRYSKIFIKVPESMHHTFLKHNFKLEAVIPRLFGGTEKGCFMGKYFNAKRGTLTNSEKHLIDKVRESSLSEKEPLFSEIPMDFEIARLQEQDVGSIAKIYRQVFQYYPFPIFQESYLVETMRTNVQYFGVFHEGKLIAVSSSELDADASNAEMTDFATLPNYRGHNLSYFLLQKMVDEMSDNGIRSVYTIARATSFGMNKTFTRNGFQFGGLLVNNTLIGDSIESMNVLYKNL